MIQRIQTVYLLLVVGLLIVGMCLPLGYFTDIAGVAYPFSPLGIRVEQEFQSSWGLFCILLLSSIVALATVFLYKRRMLQIRMTIFNTILLIGFYLAFIAFYLMLEENPETSFRIHWALCLPLAGVILNYLAIRAIGRDEVLVKAADRLR
jgi:heme/copper-type cytochrome/quinol oxidase subunit 3